MSDLNDLVDRYVAAGNERDAAARKEAVAALWTAPPEKKLAHRSLQIRARRHAFTTSPEWYGSGADGDGVR